MRFYFLFMLLLDVVASSSILKRMDKDNSSKREVEAKMETYEANKIEPPDHLKGMKIERDGDKNEHYHREVFLGVDAEKFVNGDLKTEDQKMRLEEIFNAVDLNSDSFLDTKELSLWVLTKTREHFYESRMANEKKFRFVDANDDHKVTWKEFLVMFLAQHGYDKDNVLKKLNDGITLNVSGELDNEIQDLRQRWILVQDPGAKYLTPLQFLDFEHPEMSKEHLKYLVENLLHDMDQDGNKKLTLHEYVAMPENSDVDAVNDIWVKERRNEFRDVIDADKNGIVAVEELEAYLDPLSQNAAEQEARQLIYFGDENNDDRLTLKEILENSEYYTGSKLYNYAKSIHEEF